MLDRVERLGNRVPDPLVLFTGLFLVTAVLTTVLAAVGAEVQAPFAQFLALTGLEPAFVQAAFRIGDSSTQIITPLSPYLIVLLGMVRR